MPSRVGAQYLLLVDGTDRQLSHMRRIGIDERIVGSEQETLVQRTLRPAPWLLFAGAAYVDANGPLDGPHDLAKHPSLFMMRTGVSPIWRLRRLGRTDDEVVVELTPRLLIDDMLPLKQAAIGGLGIVALPGYVCRDDVRSGALRQVLPDWIAGNSTLTALMPYRRGLLPSVRAFVGHLAAEFPKAIRI